MVDQKHSKIIFKCDENQNYEIYNKVEYSSLDFLYITFNGKVVHSFQEVIFIVD